MNNTVLSNSNHVEQKQASRNKSRIIGLYVVVLKNKIKKSETASSLETGENSSQTRSELDLLSAKPYEINL